MRAALLNGSLGAAVKMYALTALIRHEDRLILKALLILGATVVLLPKLTTPQDINFVQLIEEDIRIRTMTEIA